MVLERAGLISKEKDGRIQRCHFQPEKLDVAQQAIEAYKKFWSHQFDELEKYIKETKEKK